MNLVARKIAFFILVLALGIYFLRPKGSVSTETVTTPTLVPLPSTSQAERVQKPETALRAPSSTAPVQRPPKATTSSKENLVAQIKADAQCYQSDTCDFPNTDPHSYSFAVSRKIAAELQEFRKKYAKSFPDEARALAQNFLSNEDGFVQEAALGILSVVPANKSSLKGVAQLVTQTTDPSVVDQALKELLRYIGTPEEAEVHRALGELLMNGGLLASQRASLEMMPFLNSKSVPFYQRILSSLTPGSEVARNLRVSLQEYQRMSVGG